MKLQCTICGRLEHEPYDIGDVCSCGGFFAAVPTATTEQPDAAPHVHRFQAVDEERQLLTCLDCPETRPYAVADEDLESEPCFHCDGDGYGTVGTDWNCEDSINGPYDGEIQRCPWCHGSGLAKDIVAE